MTNVVVHIFVSDESISARGCSSKSTYAYTGCESGTYETVSAEICVCDTELCNGAVMTSSAGHVIVVVALVIAGYLM